VEGASALNAMEAALLGELEAAFEQQEAAMEAALLAAFEDA
jgi:hypothetical protein